MNIEIPRQGGVVSRFGPDAQAVIHMEECAELIQAISKMRRVRFREEDDSKEYYNLLEEMADVLISIEQIKLIYGITDHEIQSMVNKKCRRQEARLHGTQ